MLRLTLAKRPNRDDLAAFGFAAGALAAAVVAVAALVAGADGFAAAGFGAGTLALCSGVGLLEPSVLAQPYRVWNGLGRRVATLGRWLLMLVTFGVFTLAAGAGSRFERRGRPGSTGWSAKRTPALREQEGHVPAGADPVSWPSRVGRWSRGKPSRWSVLLLPFLALLGAFEGRDSVREAEDIYTLY